MIRKLVVVVSLVALLTIDLWIPRVDASQSPTPFIYYKVGRIEAEVYRTPNPNSPRDYVEYFFAPQNIYWFENDRDECYVTSSRQGGGISCLRKTDGTAVRRSE